MTKILVTGGAGYIGTHICVELLLAEYEVVVIDNLSNSCRQALSKVEEISGRTLTFYELDLCNQEALTKVFLAEDIDSVIHLAALSSPKESIVKPLDYFQNNVSSTLVLLNVMEKFSVNKLIFSSSATVYGNSNFSPVNEQHPLSASTPYGRSKKMIEEVLNDIVNSSTSHLKTIILRYFNPAGSHESGLIGKDHRNATDALFPAISRVAVGQLETVHVFGDDYPTTDGTGIRDYIHVVDLAKGHLKAMSFLETTDNPICTAINLGTGKGYSVLEVINTFSTVTGLKIPLLLSKRRPGDIAKSYADPSLAHQILQWQAEKPLIEMVQDYWNWQCKNPNGYVH